MIGAGGMANSVHYPSLASFNDVKIVAICDLNQERLNTTGNTYNIEKRYENYVKMIEDTTSLEDIKYQMDALNAQKIKAWNIVKNGNPKEKSRL